MLTPITPIIVEMEDNFVKFKYVGSGKIIAKAQKNLFEKETGLTITNPDYGVPAYFLDLSIYGTNIECGHIIDNVVGYLKNADLENIVLIVDFQDVIDISQSFAEQYITFLLSTKSKVLSINQNTNITNAFSECIESFVDIQEM